MSDETTPGPDLSERIADILDDAFPEAHGVLAVTAAITAVVRPELDRLTRERDLAIAHDTQPYPTASAYEQACKALHAHKERAEKAEAERDQFNAAIADVRRLCHLTINASCRVDAIHQAQDTLAVLDRCDLPAVRAFVADFDPREESK